MSHLLIEIGNRIINCLVSITDLRSVFNRIMEQPGLHSLQGSNFFVIKIQLT